MRREVVDHDAPAERPADEKRGLDTRRIEHGRDVVRPDRSPCIMALIERLSGSAMAAKIEGKKMEGSR